MADLGNDAAVLTLIARSGPRAGESFRLEGHTTFFVGRGPGVQLALEGDPQMSRVHFCIEYNPPHARLMDVRSRNKTYLNDQPIQQADLRDGDRIRGSNTELLVSMPGDPTESPIQSNSTPSTSAFAGPFHPAGHVGPAIPGYFIEDELAKGGMGKVYRARRNSDGQVVAIKTILPAVSPHPEAIGRFQREIHILQRLVHPRIVRHFDSGEVQGQLYFIMEYVPGLDAGRLVREQGRMTAERVVRLGCQLLDALACAHHQGIVHRDVKPSNLLLTQQDGQEVLKLADFGLARAYQASAMSGLTLSGQSGGTPAFMPPEQVQDLRSALPPADQYAVAATLYYLLTGQTIYEPAPTRFDLMLRIIQTDPIPLRQPDPGQPLPGRLGAVIRRALARLPADRYLDVKAMSAELARAL